MNLIFGALKYSFIQPVVNLCAISSFCITVKLILRFLPHKLQACGSDRLGDVSVLSSLVSRAGHVACFSFFNFFPSEPHLALQACSSDSGSEPKKCILKKDGLLGPGCILLALFGSSKRNVIPEAFRVLLGWNVLLRITRTITMPLNAHNMSSITKLKL